MDAKDPRIIRLLVILIHLTVVFSQSNYASRGVNTNYLDDGLPPEAVLNGTVTQLDTLSHAIYTNRTSATLSCATRAMDITMEFKEPFFGIVYANFDRNAACTLLGNGSTKYELQLPLQGCGTIQDPQRVFTNNIVVRFHPSLELEGDEIKTIVCRYPTPTVLPPPPAELPILQPLPPLQEVLPPAKLQGLEIILILCAILFLGLLLLGIGCASYCVKKRNIRLVRTRRALSSGPGSDITKLSTDFGSMPFFPGLKIPRAHAVDLSDMEEILDSGRGSQTLSSEYPSETHSNTEIEEGDTRSCRQSTVDSVQQVVRNEFQNRGVESDVELASQYSDHPPLSEFDMVGPLMKIPRVDPSFDVNVRVKRPPSHAYSVNAGYSDTESEFSVVDTLQAQERFLTSILEREERRLTDSEVSEHVAREGRSRPLDGPLIPPPKQTPHYGKHKKRRAPSVFALSQHSIPENDTWSYAETTDMNDARSYRAPSIPASEYPSEGRDPSVISEVPLARLAPPPKWKVKIKKYPKAPSERPESEGTETEFEDLIEPEEPKRIPPPKSASIKTASEPHELSEFEMEMPLVPHKPNVTRQEADDLVTKNVTETKTFEDEERIRRQTTEYYKKPKPSKPEFDVSIKRYPRAPSVRSESDTDWDQASEIQPDTMQLYRATEKYDYYERAEQRPPPEPIENPKPNFDVRIKKYPKPQSRPATSIPDSVSSVDEMPESPKPDFDVKIKKYPRRPTTSIPDSVTTIDEPIEPHKPEFDIKIKKYPRQPSRPATSIPDSVTTMDEESDPEPEHPTYKQTFDVKIKKLPRLPSRPATSIAETVTTVDEPEVQPDFDTRIKKHPKAPSVQTESDTDWEQASDLYIHRSEYYRATEDEERTTRRTTEYFRRPRPEENQPEKVVPEKAKPESLPKPKPESLPKPKPESLPPTTEEPRQPDFDVRIKKYPRQPSRPATSIPDSVTTMDEESEPEPDHPNYKQTFDVKIKKFPRLPSRPATSIADTVTTIDEPEIQPKPDFNVRIKKYPKPPSVQSESDTDWEQASDLYIRRSEYYRATEDEERTTRQTTEYYRRPKPEEVLPERVVPEKQKPESLPPTPEEPISRQPDFDVRIKKYPRPASSIPETTTTVNDLLEYPRPDFDVRIKKHPPPQSERPDSVATDWDEISDIYVQRTEMRRVIEDEERISRQRTELYRKPKPLPPNWDVVIRKHPKAPSERPDSETSDWDTISEQPPEYPRAETFEEPVRKFPPNWNILIRVLDSPEEPPNDRDDRTSVLTVEDRQKWADLITTDTVFREVINEAIIEEDYEIIRRDTRYHKVFQPPTWDVIIRVLQSPQVINDDDRSVTTTYSEVPIRYRKRDPKYRPASSRRTSMTSAKSDADLRSLPEDVVTFSRRQQDPDAWSQSSGYTYKSSAYPRSMADRSHAGTELVEVAYLDLDEVDSRSDRPRSSRQTRSIVSRPSLARSNSEFTEDWGQPKLYEAASDSEKSSSRNPKLQIFRRAESSGSEA